MKPENMKKKLQEIAAEYVPGRDGLYPDAPRLHAEDHYTLYKVWLCGGDVAEAAISLYMAFNQLEAAQLGRRLRTPQDFLDDLRALMDRQLIALGYVRREADATLMP